MTRSPQPPFKLSPKPCPICRQMSVIVGQDERGRKITSCGHKYHFNKTRSQKEMGRRYIQTAWGLEKV